MNPKISYFNIDNLADANLNMTNILLLILISFAIAIIIIQLVIIFRFKRIRKVEEKILSEFEKKNKEDVNLFD